MTFNEGDPVNGLVGTAIIVAASDASEASKKAALASGGYVCDGTADDVEIQAAIDALPAGGHVVCSEGNYVIAAAIYLASTDNITPITLEFLSGAVIDVATEHVHNGVNLLSDNVTLRGGHWRSTETFSGDPFEANYYGAYIAGNDKQLLGANANLGQKDITVADGTKFWVGQRVRIVEGDWYLYVNASDKTEVCVVDSIAGNVLTVRENLNNNYTVANNAEIHPYVSGCSVIEAEFEGWQYGVQTYEALDCRVVRCNSHRNSNDGIETTCYTEALVTEANYLHDNILNGLEFESSAFCKSIGDVIYNNLSRGIETDGAAVGEYVLYCTFDSPSVFNNASYGILVGDRSVGMTIVNPTVSHNGRDGKNGITLAGDGKHSIIGGTVTGHLTAASWGVTVTENSDDCLVQGVTITDNDTGGINVQGDRLRILGNSISSCAYGIRYDKDATGIIITDNDIRDVVNGIRVTDKPTGVTICRNNFVLANVAANSFYITNSPGFNYHGSFNDMFMDVLAVSTTHVRSNEDLSAATPITFTIDNQPDVPRTLSWAFDSHAQITEYDMEVVGIDAKGNTVTETWDETCWLVRRNQQCICHNNIY